MNRAVIILLFLITSGCSSWYHTPAGWPVRVTLRRVPFDAIDRTAVGSGRLLFRAGFELSADREEFGGFSGFLIENDLLTAVSDNGYWWLADLRFRGNTLAGIGPSRMGRLADLDGRPVSGRERRDAEEMASTADGVLVSFEGEHRIQHYRRQGRNPAIWDKQPTSIELPADFPPGEENGGIEAMTELADRRLLIFSESQLNSQGEHLAWVGDLKGQWQAFSHPTFEDFAPTGAATLPSGDVLLIQRSFTKERGVRGRLLLIPQQQLAKPGRIDPEELIRLQSPRSVDNLESVEVSRGRRGETLIYLLTDDNYSKEQRTLLLQFELLPKS